MRIPFFNKLLAGVGLAVPLAVCFAPQPVSAQGYRGGRPVVCGSVNGRYNRCDVGWRDAQLVHQDSDTRCIRGQNWGVERGAIWVDRGCRGQFVEAGGWGGGPQREISVQCGSVDNHYRLCPVRLNRGSDVRLVNNDSDTRCRQGYNWGVSNEGIWVDRGCRGRFVVRQR